MVRVALVHGGVLAHAILTVSVVSLLAVAGQHRHHSLDLEYVEARVVKVAEVTAHAKNFWFPLFLCHPASDGAGGHPGGGHANLAVQEVWEVQDVHWVH